MINHYLKKANTLLNFSNTHLVNIEIKTVYY